MRELLNRLFPLSAYADPLARRRAAASYFFAVVVFCAVLVGGVYNVVQGRVAEFTMPTLLRGSVLLGVSATAYVLTRRKQQELAATVMLLGWFAGVFFSTMTGLETLASGFPAILVGISLSALLIGDWTVLYATIIGLLYIAFSGMTQNTDMAIIWADAAILLVHGVVNYTLARSLRTITRQIAANLEERGVRLSRASGELVQRLLAARLELKPLLEETVKLVRGSFPGIDDARLFLLDKERKNAMLVASTSPADVGRVGSLQIGVGSLGVIGRVTITGQTLLVRDSGDEHAHRRAAFLEGTRAELVIPLRVANEVIGALDAQSRDVSGFPTEEIETLETLANQIAIAIDNARLYAEAQAKLAENQRLYEQASNNLREIERLNQQLTGGAWAEYLRGMSTVPAFSVDLITGRVEDAAEWTPTLAEASRKNQVVVRTAQQGKVVSLPIAVRGQVIGAMEFELSPDQHIGPDQMVILQQVIERLGLAAENIRLLDEAQRIAQREAMVNEITARMQAATNVEAVVAAATQSLADAFQSSRVAIRLGTPAEQQNGKNGQG